MMTLHLSDSTLWDSKADGYFILLPEDCEFSPDLQKIEKEMGYKNLAGVLTSHSFTGKLSQSYVITAPRNDRLAHCVFVGLGKQDGPGVEQLERLRRALGTVVKTIKRLRIKTSATVVPSHERYGIDEAELISQMAVVVHMADYEFTKFKTDIKEEFEGGITFALGHAVSDEQSAALAEGNVIGTSVNLTRHWADLPPNILTPSVLAEEAQKVADEGGLACTIFGREKALELGMGGFAAVDAGSDQDGKFIVLEYKAPRKDAPTLAFVGKGVTFDSGGLSLKPASYMTGMKFDMSGAAAVIGVMRALSKLKPDVHVVGVTPVVENLPSGRCNRQDDIVTFMNGKTAEIENTDAEGRLILADGLCYAEKMYAPDVIIDVATLTGGCSVALGRLFTAVMTRDEKLVKTLQDIGSRVGDRLWPLPLHDDYLPAIRSEVADLTNTGKRSYGAQSITAGLFLEQFVDKAPWVHLDIAGTADGVSGINYLGSGATGAGVRLLTEFAMTYRQTK